MSLLDTCDPDSSTMAGLASLTDLKAPNWALAACRTSVMPAGPGITPGLASVTELFFSESIPDIIAAKAICRTCDLAAQCLTAAVEQREPNGVWGGELFKEGKIVARKRPRGRPPKDPTKRLWA